MQQLRFAAALLVLAAGAAPTWAQRPVDREAALELVAAHERWAAVKGEMQNDRTFLADEVELIALGDAEGMEVQEIRGVISKLDVAKRSLSVQNYSVVWLEDARIRDADKNKIEASSIKNGVGATVEGHLKDGTFWAKDIRLRSGKMKDGKLTYKQEIIGPIQIVDLDAGLLRVLDTDVRLHPRCEFFELPMQVKSPGSK
jgi:hypothetical protein